MLGKGFADLGEILLEFLHHDVVAVIDRAGADLNEIDQYFWKQTMHASEGSHRLVIEGGLKIRQEEL